MTEQEWLQASDPEPMLEFLRGKASERKLRLFSLACCGPLLAFTDDPLCHSLFQVCSRYVDSNSIGSELAHAKEKLFSHYLGPWYDSGPRTWQTIEAIAFKMHAAAAIFCAAGGSVGQQAYEWDDFIDSAEEMLTSLYWAVEQNEGTGFTWSKESAARLLRCIFGPILFRPIILNPSWLTWHDGLLFSIAQKMYDSRNFSDMPVLADALEEAGSQDQDILGHCRSGGEHIRGCWVVDSLLGKE